MERHKMIGLLFVLAISMGLGGLVSISAPETGQISIWVPERGYLVKTIVQEISISGTMATIPFSEYQSMKLKDQKVIVQYSPDSSPWKLKIHYLGKDEILSYYTIKEYSYKLKYFQSLQIEDSALKYTALRDWVTFLLAVVGLIAGGGFGGWLAMGMARPGDC